MYRTTTHIMNVLCICYIVLFHLIRASPNDDSSVSVPGGIFPYSVVNFCKFSAVNFINYCLS